MRLRSIDDLLIDDLNLYERPIVTDRSNRLNWSVRSRQGLAGSVFFGGQAEPAKWNVLFKCNDIESRDAILAVLGGDVTEERRLLAMRDDVAQTRVLALAALTKISEPNEYDIFVDFESVAGSVWTSETVEETVKSFTSTLDQAMHLTVPGNTRTAPRLIIRPTGQRTTSTATAGWRYRRRYTVINNSDEPWYRLPLRISLGDTTPLTTTKAQADGDDVLVVIDGIERQRTLVTWDTAASYAWYIVDALPAGASMVVEVWYGNSLAANPPTLTYPNLPPFTLASSANNSWVYPTNLVAGQGAYWLSDDIPGAFPDFTIPGAWHPLLTHPNPDNPDHHAQYIPYIASGSAYAVFAASRFPANFEAIVDIANAYDGLGFYHPLGILTATASFSIINGNGVGKMVVLRRESAAADWAAVYENATVAPTSIPLVPGTQTINAKHMAYAVWPANGWLIDPDFGAFGIRVTMTSTLTLAIDTADLSITGGTEEEIYELATELRIGGGADWTPPYRALLIGNARGESGEGTPRCAVTLTQALVIDCDERTHEVWSVVGGELVTKVEAVPAHAITPVVGWRSGDEDEESPSNGFLEVVPVRNPVPNGSFDSTINGWEIGTADPVAAAGYALIATYGSTGSGDTNFNTPGQLVLDEPRDWVNIADTANNRMVQRSISTGAFVGTLTGLTGITGIGMQTGGVAGSGAVCVAFGTSLRQLNNVFGTMWTVTPGGTLKNVATDNTHNYVTDVTNHKVWKRAVLDGAAVTSWGTLGAGNTNYSAPWGIGVRSGEVYVVDSGNNRVKVTDLVGTFVRSFSIPANARGLAFDTAGNVLVAVFGSDVVNRYTNTGALIDSFSQTDPDGVAVVTGDVVWVTDGSNDTLNKWDELPAASTVRAWDAAVGGEANGSLAVAVTARTVGAESQTVSSGWFSANGRESVNLAAWVTTDDADLIPRLQIIFADDAETVLSTTTEAVWAPVAGEEYTRVLSARVPDRATQCRIGLVVYADAVAAAGEVHFDDIDLNGNVLIVSDQAMGELSIEAEVQGRWL